MFEKTDVGQLKVGMNIEEFCGSWMEHPFWHNSVVVTDAQDIDRIRTLPGVAEVQVDLVWDPPWTPSMMTEAARLELGLI